MIRDVDANFRFRADSEAAGEVSLDANPSGQPAVPGIKDRRGEEHEIIGQREPAQHGAVP